MRRQPEAARTRFIELYRYAIDPPSRYNRRWPTGALARRSPHRFGRTLTTPETQCTLQPPLPPGRLTTRA
ncbi:hypothetical protein LMG29739_02236 [Paraburkholderia solisilvae]|uniref:Uncharacterized protein n=1 Tax=Paraburkholderia solisilvae TaxID=624376 RepID=A0A6J5DNZ8_9BURK|nr:hypothetical protein LMG29739_02236 [Paraburkholderia solisilvae]